VGVFLVAYFTEVTISEMYFLNILDENILGRVFQLPTQLEIVEMLELLIRLLIVGNFEL
jgi:hypothetical protein